jgi:hypothetical protein
VTQNAHGAVPGESKPLTPADMITSLRDLIVHLHRGNGEQAETLVTAVSGYLKAVMLSGADPASFDMQRAQQTMFAIDEVRMLLTQGDFEGAASAARDSAKEWKQKPSQVD